MRVDFEEVGVTDLGKSYGPTLALAGVDLTFTAGTVTVIRGANGSGKSTLLGIASGFVDPDLGTIQIGDKPLRRDSPAIDKEKTSTVQATDIKK